MAVEQNPVHQPKRNECRRTITDALASAASAQVKLTIQQTHQERKYG